MQLKGYISDLDLYQEKAMSYRMASATLDYALLNLSGEVGELNSLIAKRLRDGVPVVEGNADYEGFFLNIQKELGDILWHVAAIAQDYGLNLSDVAWGNIAKLDSRKARGVLTGSGDNR